MPEQSRRSEDPTDPEARRADERPEPDVEGHMPLRRSARPSEDPEGRRHAREGDAEVEGHMSRPRG